MKPIRQSEKHTTAEHLYALLLHLYPPAHRQAYGPLMWQAFRDSYRDTLATEGKVGLRFWFGVVDDEARGITREQGAAIREHLHRLRVLKIDRASGIALLGGGLVYAVRCVI
jgi:hypothetical protein